MHQEYNDDQRELLRQEQNDEIDRINEIYESVEEEDVEE